MSVLACANAIHSAKRGGAFLVVPELEEHAHLLFEHVGFMERLIDGELLLGVFACGSGVGGMGLRYIARHGNAESLRVLSAIPLSKD